MIFLSSPLLRENIVFDWRPMPCDLCLSNVCLNESDRELIFESEPLVSMSGIAMVCFVF